MDNLLPEKNGSCLNPFPLFWSRVQLFSVEQRNKSRTCLPGEKNSNFVSILPDISYFLVFLRSFIISFVDDSFSFHFSLFDLVILLFRRRCHTFSRILMLTIRGDCGHLKALWDNNTNCLSCSSCSRYSTYLVCRNWIGSKWKLADKRR